MGLKPPGWRGGSIRVEEEGGKRGNETSSVLMAAHERIVNYLIALEISGKKNPNNLKS